MARRGRLGLILTAGLVALIAGSCGSESEVVGADYSAEWGAAQIPGASVEDEYKSLSQQLGWEDFASFDENAHEGEVVYFEGVLEVGTGTAASLIEEGSDSAGHTVFWLGVGDEQWGKHTAIQIVWPGPLPGAVQSGLFDADVFAVDVQVWGESQGLDGGGHPVILGRYLSCYVLRHPEQ